MKHPANPPENVRIVRPDGTEIPCELRYTGLVPGSDGQPIHHWDAITEYTPVCPPDKIRVGTLPARTEISLTVKGPDVKGPDEC